MKNGDDRATTNNKKKKKKDTEEEEDVNRIVRAELPAEFAADFAEANGKTIQQVRSDEPICKKCPSKKRVTFLREHAYLKRRPATITCPNCLQAVETIVERHNTPATHLAALLLTPVCLCILPYCSKVLRDSVHRCPSCGINLGSCFASAREAFVVCLSERQSNTRNNNDGESNEGAEIGYPPEEQDVHFF